MTESEQGFKQISEHTRNRAIRLVATLIKGSETGTINGVALNGMEKALDYFPETFQIPDRNLAKQFLEDLYTWEGDRFEDIPPLTLSKDVLDLFIGIDAGINEKQAEELKKFFHEAESDQRPDPNQK